MLRVVIVGYGEMFTNLIAGALDANVQIVGVFRKEMIKYPKFIRKIKDVFNPSLEHNYIKSYNLPEIEASSVNSKKFKELVQTCFEPALSYRCKIATRRLNFNLSRLI